MNKTKQNLTRLSSELFGCQMALTRGAMRPSRRVRDVVSSPVVRVRRADLRGASGQGLERRSAHRHLQHARLRRRHQRRRVGHGPSCGALARPRNRVGTARVLDGYLQPKC